MKLKSLIHLILSSLLITLPLMGCATQPTGPMAANEDKVTAFEPFHDVVDMKFVENHISIPMPEGVMLIDARPYQPKYIKGHIPLAVSIPDSQFAKMTDKLPADKDSLLIFYCGGLKCKLSHKSARKAETLGYTNVKVFAEGYPKWIEDKTHYPAVSAEWVKQQIDRGECHDAGGLPSQAGQVRQRPYSLGHQHPRHAVR